MKRALIAVALLLAAGEGAVTRLGAQVVDTTRADTTAADTTDYTAQFLQSQLDVKKLVPVVPRIGAAALLPARTRIVLDRDSVLWFGAETVSDLLMRVPGLYLLRGGWAGRPELPAYQARGSTSVRYLLDGIPYFALGQDSTMVDPSVLPVSFLDRVEIDRLPGELVVWLFTRRNDRSAPYSRIGIASGDYSIARYQGQLEKRSAKGPGIALAFDHFSVGSTEESDRNSYSNLQAWIRLEYIRSAKAGVEAQFFRNSPEREAILSGSGSSDTLSRARAGSRHDLSLRGFYAPGSNGLGPRLDFVASKSGWADEIEKDSTLVIEDIQDSTGAVIGQDSSYSVDKHHRGVTQLGLLGSYRLPAASLDGSVFWRSTWTPLTLQARGGVSPSRFLTLSLEAVHQRHDGSRSDTWLTARGGVELPFGFTASAIWRKGHAVFRPAIREDSAQSLDDRSVSLAWRSPFAELEGSFTTNAGFRPSGYTQYPALDSIAPSGRTDWIAVSGRISPRQWLSLSGWYSRPLRIQPEGQPPSHVLLYATLQSKFLPTFRSGIFNLKIQASLEHWSNGVLGHDSSGAAVNLTAATYFRGYLGLQIGSFTAYYDFYNLRGSLGAYVPGLPVPQYPKTFGVRWEFAN